MIDCTGALLRDSGSSSAEGSGSEPTATVIVAVCMEQVAVTLYDCVVVLLVSCRTGRRSWLRVSSSLGCSGSVTMWRAGSRRRFVESQRQQIHKRTYRS